MPDPTCSCGSMIWDGTLGSRRWGWRHRDGLYPVNPTKCACPDCRDWLLPGGKTITAAQLQADHKAMQAMRSNTCTWLVQDYLLIVDGVPTLAWSAMTNDPENGPKGVEVLPEAAVAALSSELEALRRMALKGEPKP